MKWNPHIHALISEGGAGNTSVWRPVKHFDYNFLRIASRKVLLEQFIVRISSSFRKVKNELYTKYADGFYVRAKSNLGTPDITIKYISRYLGRPVIVTSRIDNYDGENVTFHYARHEDSKTIFILYMHALIAFSKISSPASNCVSVTTNGHKKRITFP